MLTSCAVFLEEFAQTGVLATAYYAHLIPVAIALLLSTYALVKTKASALAVLFFLFTLSFSLWLLGDLVTWTNPAYDAIIYAWSWLDLVNIAFFVLGAYFFSYLTRAKIALWEKAAYVALMLPALALTVTGNSITEFYQPYCEATNNELLTNYKLFAEGAAAFLIVLAFARVWRESLWPKRLQLLTLGLAILAFFGVFAGTEYVASMTGIYEINLYGLFILPLFLLLLTFAITDLRLFQLRFVGTQILAYVLIVMVASQLLFITDSASRNLSLVTLAMSLVIGVFLIENAKSEAEARIRIEELARDLSAANDQQVTLIHFITHQVKGFVTKSRNIFATLLDGDMGTCPDNIRPLIEEGLRSDTQGVTTIQEILNAANIKSGKVSYDMKPFDLRALVEEVVVGLRPTAQAKSLVFTANIGDAPLTVTGDRAQLVNAYKNLIDNSIKYTQKGSVAVFLKQEGGKAVFKIEDTGVGISKEDMSKLFTEGGHGKESVKVNVESTGFGLYIVKNIIDAHKGRVFAESAGAGKGSRFTIELPI